MKVIYHQDYQKVYASDPAANAGRMEAILKELEGYYDFLEPAPASEDDLRRIHDQSHIDSISRDPPLYQAACLSAEEDKERVQHFFPLSLRGRSPWQSRNDNKR